MITVLVVDDSAFMRKVISDLLSSDKDINVVGTAYNGLDAIKKTRDLKPDVMTLDFEMPEMNGIEVIEKIISEIPLPIILLTGTSDASKTIEALNKGAVDFLLKPSGSISLDIEKIKYELIEKVKAAHASSMKKLLAMSLKQRPKKITFASTRDKIVVIASSTGGPKTLETLLSQFPKNVPVPILVVQHMSAGFTNALAQRLNRCCDIEVKEAEQNELLRNGVAFIAPGDFHMEIELLPNGDKIIKLNQEPSELGVRPNANRLFISAANIFRENTIAIVLTGMGTDGTEGCRKIKQHYGFVIAEAEESCVVYGMPKSVVEARLASMILALDKIPIAALQAIDV